RLPIVSIQAAVAREIDRVNNRSRPLSNIARRVHIRVDAEAKSWSASRSIDSICNHHHFVTVGTCGPAFHKIDDREIRTPEGANVAPGQPQHLRGRCMVRSEILEYLSRGVAH